MQSFCEFAPELCNMWWLHCILLNCSVDQLFLPSLWILTIKLNWTEALVLIVTFNFEAYHCVWCICSYYLCKFVSDQISTGTRKNEPFFILMWPSQRSEEARQLCLIFLFHNVSLIRKLNSWHNKKKVTCGCVLIERLTAGRTDN